MEKLSAKQLSVISSMDELETDEQKWAVAYAWTMLEIGSYPEEKRDAMIEIMGIFLEFRGGHRTPK